MSVEKNEQPPKNNSLSLKKKEDAKVPDNYVYGEDCLYGGSDYTYQERIYMKRDDDF